MQKRTLPLVQIVMALLVMWALLTFRIAVPWFGHHDENGAVFSAAARNYALYDSSVHHYLQSFDTEPVTAESINYYVHHPPLIAWSLYAGGALFGRDATEAPLEMAARWVPASATLVSLAAFYVIVRRLFGQKRALAAMLIYGLTPMIAYFGRMPNHEPLALLFLLLFAAVFINWLRAPTTSRWLALLLWGGLAMWSAWAAAFFLFTFGVVALWLGSARHRRDIVVLGVLIGLITLAIPAFYEMQHSGAIENLMDQFSFRSSNHAHSRGSETFTLGGFVIAQLAHMLPTVTIAILVLGIIGIWLTLRRESRMIKAMLLAFIGGALLYMLVFRNAFYIHDYYKIYFMPGLVLGTSVTIAYGSSRRRLRRWAQPTITALFIVSAVISLVFFALLHQSVDEDFSLGLAEVLIEETDGNDLILTNRGFTHSAVEFYATREVEWSVMPHEALEMSAEADRPTFYIYCLENEDDAAPPPQFEDDPAYTELLAEFPYTHYAMCRIITLRDS